MAFDDKVIKRFEGKESKELLKAPPFAISGVSQADAEKLKEAFGIDSIREMAALSYYRHAKDIVKQASKQLNVEEEEG